MQTMTKERAGIAFKAFAAEVKAEPPEDGATTGTFEARVAAYGNVDLGGDRIEEGAFDDTLKAWGDSGDPIPVIWSHQWDDPMAHIGTVTEARSTEDGLDIVGELDLTTDLARQVHRLMVGRRVKEFSFAYMPTDAAPDDDDDRVRVLRGLDLIEVGPTLKGMNPETELYGAKSALARHSSGTSDEDWDAAAMVGRLPSSEAALRAAHAWRDPDGDADAKSSYKFPHHMVGTDGRVGAANLRGSSAGIGALNGARGGTSIPAADRSGVYGHLAGHLRDGDRDVPDLRSLDDLENDEKETPPPDEPDEPEVPDDVPAEGEPDPAEDREPVHASADPEAKVGRVLSKANETKLREAGKLISDVLASLPTSADEGEDGKAASSADRGEARSTIDRLDAAVRLLETEVS
jgi:HK97 family phage prohead protease